MLAELWRQYKHEGNTNAREELVLECLPMVKALAQRFAVYTFPCCDNDDLVSMGVIGLLDALEKYDPVMQTSFRTYAKYRIRGAILDEIRNIQWTPRSIQEKIQNLKRAYARLEQSLSRSPTETELADALDMNIRQFRRMLVQIGPSTLLMLSQKLSERDDTEYQETPIEDPNAPDPLNESISHEIRSLLANAIRSLPEREALVITLYYYEEMTMKEIGKVFSLTESRICQIHSSALLHLFHELSTATMEAIVSVPQEAVAD
ncbi:FliA/WhiG family RNA polymerase sigma factor [Candidatus Poribacteria bacterium]